MLTKSTQRLSRRQFLKVSSLVGAGTLAAACSPAAPTVSSDTKEQPTSNAAAPAKTKITFQHWGNALEAAGYKNVLDTFMAKYPNIEAEQLYVPAASQYGEKLMTALAGGTGPDVFRVEGGYSSGLLATQGSLLQLELVYHYGGSQTR